MASVTGEEDFVQVTVAEPLAPHLQQGDIIHQNEMLGEGGEGANQELKSETVLKEMWQESEDPDEKRQLRSRIFKLREDRLKDFYGRDGQEILDSILKPEVITGNEDVDGAMTLTSTRAMTTSEIQSGETQTQTVKTASASVELKQNFKSTTVVDGKEDLKEIKNRINKRDRASQLKEIEEQSPKAKKILAQRSSSGPISNNSPARRKSSVGEIDIINITAKKSQRRTINNAADVFNNNKSKVVVMVTNNNNNNNGMENRVSKMSKRLEGGITHTNNNIVATTNGKSSVTSKTTMGALSSARVGTDGRKNKTRETSTTTSTTVTKTKSSTTATIKSSSSSSTTTTATAFSSVSLSSNRKTDSVKNTVGSRSGRAPAIPLGSVQIQEIVEAPVLALTGGQAIGAKTSTNVTGGRKELRNKKLDRADGEAINRNLKSAAAGGGGGGGQVTKSELKKTSVAKSSSRGSTSNSDIHGPTITTNTRNGTSAQGKGTKVLNKSRETSPQRSATSTKGNSWRGSKTSSKTVESLQTPVIKVDRAEVDGRESTGLKKDNNKTEESIIRELDILDNYLSQRSISIDESNAKEVKMNGTTNASTMQADHKKKVVPGGGGGGGGVDVMESGLEPPFTKSEYKYHCPADDHHDRHGRGRDDHYHEDQGDKATDKNTNESKSPQSGRDGKTHTSTGSSTDDTKLNSNIEDQIMVDVEGLGKWRTRPVAKTNLSTNSGGSPSKSNIKKSSAVIDEISATNKKVLSATFFKKPSESEVQTKQAKYEADILSRPSVFEGRKGEVKSKPDPNPRVKKDGAEEEEEDYSHFVNLKVKGSDLKGANDEDGDDDPLKPTMKQNQDQDHPGAVLKAKSLFENKAQEAAMDRTSADFDLDKGITQTAKVSKKAALFEARSRGERISVSSESSIANSAGGATEEGKESAVDADLGGVDFCNKENNSGSGIDNVEAVVVVKSKLTSPKSTSMKREKSSLTSTSMKRESKVENESSQKSTVASSSATTTTTRTGSFTRKHSKEEGEKSVRRKSSELKCESSSDLQKTSVSNSTQREKVNKKGRASEGKNETTTTDSTTREQSPKPRHEKKCSSPPVRRFSQEEALERKHERRRSSSSPRKSSQDSSTTLTCTKVNSHASRSDKVEQDGNKYVATTAPITITSTSAPAPASQINSNRMTTAEFNAVDALEDIEELQRLLDKAVDYDERSKIRGRIRALKRKAALVKRPSSENNNAPTETSFMPSALTNVTTNASDVVNIMNVKNKAVSSSNSMKKSYERRRSSGEVPANKVTTRKKSAEVLERKNSDKSDKKSNKDAVKSAVIPETQSIVTAHVTISSSSSTGERVIKEYAGERRLSSETQELLSTRKYSRGTGKQGENEKIQGNIIAGSGSREESPIPMKEKEQPPLSRKSCRDKSSPPRAVSALIESVSASVSTQKSREMTKAEKYESDILSRPSVFCKRRQLEQEQQEFIKNEGVQLKSQTKTGKSTTTTTRKVSSRKNSEEIADAKKQESNKTLSKDNDEQPKGQRLLRKKSSTEEKDVKSSASSTRTQTTQQHSTYTRKSSSKELKVVEKSEKSENNCVDKSEKIEMVSKIPTHQNQAQSTAKGNGGGSSATRTVHTKDDQKSEDDKHKSDTEINFNQEQQSQSPLPTLYHPKSQPEQQVLKKVESNNANTVKNEGKQVEARRASAATTTTTTSSKNYSKPNVASSHANPSRLQGTDTVTSSYGVGPTDDHGAPLFGLRALRKIKQVQEQIATTTPATITSKVDEISKDFESSTKQSLRSNENFGLRALKKGSVVSRGFEDEEKSTKSSVPRGSTPERKSEFLSSTTTTRLESSDKGAFNAGMSTSPKSILKKTSSFTSQIGGVVKSMSDEGNNSDEIGDSVDDDGVEQDEFTTTTTTNNKTSTHSLDDCSWRRKSASPSPDPSITTTIHSSSLSRGKIGRSSVKEMSKRFETSETSETSQSQQNEGDSNKTLFIRATSPSRIPSPVKANTTTTTITTTTKSSVEVSGGDPDTAYKVEVSREPSIADHEEVYYPSDSDGGGSGIIRITRTVTTTSSSGGGGGGRSFLNDQSPIQNLSDVIERMKGEDEQRKYAEDFEEETCSTGEGGEKPPTATDGGGLSLLNKFIGAQIIMQAVEPMLVTKKVTMSSSSLIVNGVNVDLETDTAKLRQLLAEVDGGDRERIENRLRILESGSTEAERSSSTSSVPRSRPLTKTLSIGGVQLGSAEVGDVAGELMPLILGQLQSSLDNYGASGSALGSGGSGGNISNNTCTNTNSNALQIADTNTKSSTSSSSDSSSKCDESSSSVVGSGEECLFDSGTESGEDAAPPVQAAPAPSAAPPTCVPIAPNHTKSESSPAEFSNFMEGLRNTLKRNQNKESILRSLSHFDALGALSGVATAVASASDPAIAAKAKGSESSSSAFTDGGGGAVSASDGVGNLSGNNGNRRGSNKSSVKEACANTLEAETDRNLVQQVDKVLTLLRDSLLKDPNSLKSLGCSDLPLNPESEKGKELIALIDRLKTSLSSGNIGGGGEASVIKESPTLPTVISTCEQTDTAEQPCINTTAAARAQEMLAWAQIRPPDTVPLPWVNHMQPPTERKNSTGGDADNANDHYAHKGKGRRRSHTRSHTVGVTQEELAEARRYLQESAYRNALEEKKAQKKALAKNEPDITSPLIASVQSQEGGRRDSSGSIVDSSNVDRSNSRDSVSKVSKEEHELARQSSWHQDVEKGLTNMPRPYVKSDSGIQPPHERRMTYATIDDSTSSVFGTTADQARAKGSQFAKVKPFRTISLDNAYDPSKTFFTKEETVQIAIHQAAIKKQMSEEEDRRKRRSSLSSSQNIYGSTTGTSPGGGRDFSLALPKPYAPPQQPKKQMQTNANSSGSGVGSQNNAAITPLNDDHCNKQMPNQSGDRDSESGSDNRHPRNDQLVLYESTQMSPISISSSPRGGFTTASLSSANSNSNQRIENVQISLKELNTSEFPQLQIAITLNTNAGNNGPGNNNNAGNPSGNNIITSTNNNNESTIQSHFLAGRKPNNNSGGTGGSGNTSSNTNQLDETQSSTSSSKAMRYKSKSERKNRLKRANTIDIPQPPSYLQSNDDDSEMEDEEDSDVNMQDPHDHANPNKAFQITYAPFKPKTEGDKKFLAFLEKNNAAVETRPVRPAYLGANDKFWNNRFFNLKSNFESSSQGSSPSPSPILSPNRAAPRSVSEMALTHGRNTPDAVSRPVWASSCKSQVPQQVRNKLHVFESKNMEASKEIPWRSSAQSHISQSHNRFTQPQPHQPVNRVPGQFVASSSVYSTSNVPIHPRPNYGTQQQTSNLQRPVAVRGIQQNVSQQQQQQQQPQLQQSHHPPKSVHPSADGVHMVHATASALEAMKRSGFGPTAVVHPHPSQTRESPRTIPHQQQAQIPSPVPASQGLIVQEKIELPWAKKGPLSPSEASTRDPNAGRILMSKAKFEHLNDPGVVPMAPAVAHVAPNIAPPPIPPKSANAKAFAMSMSQNQENKVAPTSRQSVPNVSSLSGNYGQAQQYSPAVGPKPKFGTFGVTHSFDEALKRKVENEQGHIGNVQMQRRSQEPQQMQKTTVQSVPSKESPPQQYQRQPGSAFARNVTAPSSSSANTQFKKSPQEEDKSDRKTSLDEGTDVQIQTPVVAKVMGAAQQQRAAIAGNQISSRQNEEQASRLTNARSNIRNILNQFSHSPTDDSSDTNSPPIMKANLQLTLPNPLSKSLSGDTLLQSSHGGGHSAHGRNTNYRPQSLVVGPEEISMHSAHSPSMKNTFTSNKSAVASALSPTPPSASVSPQPQAGKRTSLPSPSPMSDQESNKRPLQNRPIPKQRSLSEFPKIAAAAKIGILTIQTDIEALTQAKKSLQPPVQHKSQTKVPANTKVTPTPTPTPQSQQSQRNFPVQKQSSLPQQQLLQQMKEQPPKVLKSYPTSDSLQRTSSGSSIFNRAQSLFLSSQEDLGIPPSMKNRQKPPSLSKTRMFPKQFEAQMSPDSAKKKQREIDAYFKQLTQQSKTTLSSSTKSTSNKTHLRKSASHSKILNRQRSLSDGEDDVDQIFESLFKASEQRFSLNRSQISRAWASSSSKSLDMSNLMIVGGSNEGASFPYKNMQSPLYKPSYNFGQQQMQNFCESKRLVSFEEEKEQLKQYQQKPHPFFNSFDGVKVNKPLPPLPQSPHIQQSITQSQSKIVQSSSSNSSSSMKSTSCSSSTTASSTSVGGVGGGAGLNKFKQMDQQARANSGGGASLFKLNPGLKTSANNAKDIILYWCQCRTRDYENVKIENFSSSWSDGLAFCALIHHFFPDAFDYNSLDPRNRRHNFDLAFRVADEKAGIYPLLDTEDMIIMGRRPDWKCVFTYVQSLYRGLKDLS